MTRSTVALVLSLAAMAWCQRAELMESAADSGDSPVESRSTAELRVEDQAKPVSVGTDGTEGGRVVAELMAV